MRADGGAVVTNLATSWDRYCSCAGVVLCSHIPSARAVVGVAAVAALALLLAELIVAATARTTVRAARVIRISGSHDLSLLVSLRRRRLNDEPHMFLGQQQVRVRLNRGSPSVADTGREGRRMTGHQWADGIGCSSTARVLQRTPHIAPSWGTPSHIAARQGLADRIGPGTCESSAVEACPGNAKRPRPGGETDLLITDHSK